MEYGSFTTEDNMTKSYQNTQLPFEEGQLSETAFFNDVLDLFMGFRSGHVSKYIYEAPEDSLSERTDEKVLWGAIIEEGQTPYYLPKADNELLCRARQDLVGLVPSSTPVVDFGVGDIESFVKHALPVLKALKSDYYVGIDFCEAYLERIQKRYNADQKIKIVTVCDDFFEPQIKTVTPVPALGLMTCSTIGNIHGTLHDSHYDANLSRALRILARLTNHGWLLASLDTNQDAARLYQGYQTELLARLFLTVFRRIPVELGSIGFDPSLFVYEPEWHPELQLFAHMARATAAQDFRLGDYRLHIAKGQKFHLLNSYKFEASFFEACCDKAGLAVQQVWHHETPMKLYLLKDKACRL
ncbi:MAG: L-histidine N(alpha)-methyltransferase [Alphaproteobacteria bacterium]|nr:L-histidine N(alpha)-methyltransferase [Alphaproteobacteria bacterium]